MIYKFSNFYKFNNLYSRDIIYTKENINSASINSRLTLSDLSNLVIGILLSTGNVERF
jgi:hypothetical protein